MVEGDFLNQEYRERQLIQVVKDDFNESEYNSLLDSLLRLPEAFWNFYVPGKSRLSLVEKLKMIYPPAGWDYLWQNFVGNIDLVKPIKSEVAGTIKWPPGHPKPGIVYAGHPLRKDVYYPIADFHVKMVEDKISEFFKIFRSLGAMRISIGYNEGRKETFEANLDKIIEGCNTFSSRREKGIEIKTADILNPVKNPSLPPSNELVWYHHEPLWQDKAKACLEKGIKETKIELLYTDDYSIDTKLDGKIKNLNLGIGGKFNAFERVSWEFAVEFG